MADNKMRTRIDDSGIIIRDSPEYRALVAGIQEMTALAERIPALVKPALMGERYLTTEQILTHLHISRRTLQNYRDKGIIPYIHIGGIILYPESAINEVLNENYYSVLPIHKDYNR